MAVLTASAILLVLASAASAQAVTLSGYIGSHKLSFRAQEIKGSASFAIKGAADYLAITEVYPDTPQEVVYRYRLSAPGIGTIQRVQRSVGFGPVTWYVKVRRNPVGPVKVVSMSSPSPIISSIRGVAEAELNSLLSRDKFRLLGLIPGGAPEERGKWMEMLATKLGSKPEFGITTGFSSEIYYANRDRDDVKEQLLICADWARKHKLAVMLGLVSWWAGTPVNVADGHGGRFGDVKYQQVCYSPDVETDENPELKKLLGDRYNRHYGLSVPNQWSNCPWLTMNSDVLNQYRYRRYDEAIAMLKDLCGADVSWIIGIFLENEPRYWDKLCEDWNPHAGRQGKELWADFNPLAIEAAKKDGVELDPSDGLSKDELSWLHRNVGRYNQETFDSVRASMKKHDFGEGLPLYTHSLQLREMFPGGPINHPASEWAYVDNCRTGIEGMWSQPSDFTRLREWGPWANLNREENDGRHTDWHLWDLRVAYMMGADLYNSYNWHAIGAERFFAYVDEFLRELPVVTLPPHEVRHEDGVLVIKLPMKLQAFSRIELPIDVAGGPVRGSACLRVESKTGGAFFSEETLLALTDGRHVLGFDFTTPAEAKWDDAASITVQVSDAKRKPIGSERVRLSVGSANQVRLSLDLRTQRGLSLDAIAHAKRPPSGKDPL